MVEELSGTAYSVPVFYYFYASTGMLLAIGMIIDVCNKLKRKTRSTNVDSLPAGKKLMLHLQIAKIL